MVVSCKIKNVDVVFDAMDMNNALGLATKDFVDVPTSQEITDFMDFINYDDTIDLARINKKHLRREWSFLFDTVLKSFYLQKNWL